MTEVAREEEKEKAKEKGGIFLNKEKEKAKEKVGYS